MTGVMARDNATLLYPGGIKKWVNLDNGFFLKVAMKIVNYKNTGKKRTTGLGKSPPIIITPEEITYSYTPNYIEPTYGSKSILSSCIATCLANPNLYNEIGRDEMKLRNGTTT